VPSSDDRFHPYSLPRDLLDFADPEHPGVHQLRAAVRALDAGEVQAAVDAATEARRIGVPAELVPYRAIVQGIALVRAGDPGAAATVLTDAWSSHPDVAALPAALGAAQAASGEAAAGVQSMFAAIVSDDPDHSLPMHRRRLTPLLALLRTS
jgi:hypothetical protein